MRKVRFADSEDMVSLSKLYQSQGWESFTEERIVHLLESSHYMLIEENGVIIAFLRYLTDDVLTTFIAEILVDKAFRGQGLGRLLVEEIMNLHPKTRLELISEADDFYNHLGFRNVGKGYRFP
ncbi:GNAT family N-acetyltransferase [Streptococcus pluranimalium]|uniref:GNAT family N-acetyltransferase n=1 Tax=Streptococcus pluranimalium TaxID=82348 RepID=UPI00292EAFCA|nr:GNAT family N-acetyltransferase [Streptococcus pluranimalium]MDY3041972.1 GNAT family N-acetyltransferase [Streptococcus pluranimalium]HEM6116682.1 GNAT family N-acetyltransferase [Streptococcus suis]